MAVHASLLASRSEQQIAGRMASDCTARAIFCSHVVHFAELPALSGVTRMPCDEQIPNVQLQLGIPYAHLSISLQCVGKSRFWPDKHSHAVSADAMLRWTRVSASRIVASELGQGSESIRQLVRHHHLEPVQAMQTTSGTRDSVAA